MVMELDIWNGDWGLPSVDIDCLQVLAYAKFSGAPVKVNCTNNPFWSTSGSLPVFRHSQTVLTSLKPIVEYLHSQKFSADFNLTAKEKAECSAFSELLRAKLLPGILYIWWVDQKNYTEVTRPWYAKAIPFPFNYYYPGKFERNAKEFVETMFPDEDDLLLIETHLYGEAEKCLTALATRLGEGEFFFGKSPTSLDAIVYGYLAPIARAPLINTILQNHIKACPNLTKFIARISQRYFPQRVQDFESKRSEEKSKEVEVRSKQWRQLWSFAAALTAMSSYAIFNGVLKNGKDEIEMENQLDSWCNNEEGDDE